MVTFSVIRAVSYLDVGPRVSRKTNALRIKFLPKYLPRDGCKTRDSSPTRLFSAKRSAASAAAPTNGMTQLRCEGSGDVPQYKRQRLCRC